MSFSLRCGSGRRCLSTTIGSAARSKPTRARSSHPICGVYGRTDAAYDWLAATLTTERLAGLLPEAAGLPATRELLPNLRAVLFQIPGLLGDGVAAGTRFDPQGKAVGEWLRSRLVDVPAELLP